MINKFDYLNHNFTGYYNGTIWYHCLKCNIKVYESLIDDVLKYWPDDPFHIKLDINRKHRLEYFNFSCDEIIIKKIIE